MAVFQVIFTKSVNNNVDSYFDLEVLNWFRYYYLSQFSTILSECLQKEIDHKIDFDSLYDKSQI